MNWIKCSDQLPEIDGHYLVFEDDITIAEFSTKSQWFYIILDGDFFNIFPTHWMELPEEPNEMD